MGSRGALTLKTASGHEFFVSGSPSSLEQRTWFLASSACPSEADYLLSRSERLLRVTSTPQLSLPTTSASPTDAETGWLLMAEGNAGVTLG